MNGFAFFRPRNILASFAVAVTLGGCAYPGATGSDNYAYYDEYCDPYAEYDVYYECDNLNGFGNIGFNGGYYDGFFYPGHGLLYYDNFGRAFSLTEVQLLYWSRQRFDFRRRQLGRRGGFAGVNVGRPGGRGVNRGGVDGVRPGARQNRGERVRDDDSFGSAVVREARRARRAERRAERRGAGQGGEAAAPGRAERRAERRGAGQGGEAAAPGRTERPIERRAERRSERTAERRAERRRDGRDQQTETRRNDGQNADPVRGRINRVGRPRNGAGPRPKRPWVSTGNRSAKLPKAAPAAKAAPAPKAAANNIAKSTPPKQQSRPATPQRAAPKSQPRSTSAPPRTQRPRISPRSNSGRRSNPIP